MCLLGEEKDDEKHNPGEVANKRYILAKDHQKVTMFKGTQILFPS